MLYRIATGIKEKNRKKGLAKFLHVEGEETIEKYNGFTINSMEVQRNLEAVI